MIKGISHITFVVKNMNKTARLLKNIFDAKKVYSSTKTKYFLIANTRIALNPGEALKEKNYNHVAFEIDEKDINKYLERIEESGLHIKKGRSRKDGEEKSIYFYDYDNHLFELHTGSLKARLLTYRK